jgi:VanZ family protein
MSALKTYGVGLEAITAIERTVGGDKAMHFCMALVLAILACFASERVLDLRPIGRTIVAITTCLLMLVTDEVMQIATPSRKFELLDLVWGCSGLVSGAFVYWGMTSARSLRK